ncbi:diacylglycerol kinase family protein [Fodinicurvata sp. EGI_FJ10296]|uniref:diacylglycerol/lipid kinase family protein n=1 Tax=Fodinicurvata sp. EGI_FJ10296 TaxID=3231908 RepID=UPI0034542729
MVASPGSVSGAVSGAAAPPDEADEGTVEGAAAGPGGRAVVIVNPRAGPKRSRRLMAAVARLRESIGTVEILETGRPGHATDLARDAVGRASLIIAAGGDGTIAEIVDGMATGAADAGRPVPLLGILPVGTANVLAAELGLTSCETAVERIVTGAVREVRVGIFECVSAAGTVDRRHFMSMVGAGFDADVVASVSPAWKSRMGKAAYALAAIRRLVQPCSLSLRVGLDGGAPVTVASAVICNTHFYGGRFVLAPRARAEDATFQVCLFKKAGRWAALRYMAAMIAGRMPSLDVADYEVVPARDIEVSTDFTSPSAVQADGDFAGWLPIRVWVASSPLRVAA